MLLSVRLPVQLQLLVIQHQTEAILLFVMQQMVRAQVHRLLLLLVFLKRLILRSQARQVFVKVLQPTLAQALQWYQRVQLFFILGRHQPD